MAPPAYPPSTRKQIGAALQQAGQYADLSDVLTPENPPESMAPGLGTVGGAPVAEPEIKPIPEKIPGATLVQPEKAPASKESAPKQSDGPEKIPGATLLKPEEKAPAPAPKETTEPEKIPGATLVRPETQTQEPAGPQPPKQPLQIPVPTPESTEADPHDQINELIAQGKTPGEAQAIVQGQEPKTLTGKTPKPKPEVTIPAPPTPSASDEEIRAANERALVQPPPVEAKPPAEAKPPTPVDTLKAGDRNRVDPVALYSYLLGKFSNSGLVGYVPPDGARWGIKTGSAAEWAAFGLAVAKQESDLNATSYNAADPGGSVGLFQFGQGQKQFTKGADQYDPQQSADTFVRAVQHYLANKGSVANLGETFGSIRRPNEAGQYIAGAQKVAAGGNGKDLVSSGSKSKAPSGAVPPGGSPFANQPTVGLDVTSSGGPPVSKALPTGSSGGGGGDVGPSPRARQEEVGSVSYYPSFGGGGRQAEQPQQKRARPPKPEEEEDPMVAALMKRGFTQQQAIDFAQSSQTIAPGKGVPPLRTAPPAPSTPPQLPSIKLSAKGLMPSFKAPSMVPKKPAPPAPGPPKQLPAPQTQTPQQPQAQQPARRVPPPPAPPPASDLPQPRAPHEGQAWFQQAKETMQQLKAEREGAAPPTKGAITSKVQAWLGSLSSSEREAVDHFLAGRPGIQRGTDPKSAAWDSAIAKAPIHEGTVFRGLAGLSDADVAKLKAGTVHNQYDSSASADPQNAKDFSRITFINEDKEPQKGHSAVLEINGKHRAINPEGSLDIRTGVPYQKEVILPKGTDYNVRQFLENHYGPNQHHVVLDQVSAPEAPSAPSAPAEQPKPQQTQEPAEFTGAPAGSTRGNPTPPGHEAIKNWPRLRQQAEQHASILSPDDPRVKKQADGYIKGEHFVEGDPFHENILSGLPYGKQGRQRQLLGHIEQAIADSSPMHISYISAPKEAAKFPTRETRKVQYDEHSPEARLMGTTEGQLVGHSMIPLTMGVKLSTKGSEPHESYVQGISTNVLANNFQHINDKLASMGRKTPYEKLGSKFYNDLQGYLSNLNAGHTATGRGHAIGTEDHPNTPDPDHVPYQLTRKEADFIGATINNTAAFAGHDDAKKVRELARANGTLITEKGETNRLLHDIEQHEPGWSGRGSGKRGRVLEPSIRSFKTGLIHEIHPSEEHMPATIRPGKEYQQLTKAVASTSERGRPDIPIAASLHHNLDSNRVINQIEREFSEDKITEEQARKRLADIGEDPGDYKFVSGSGGLVSPDEDDGEQISPEEHNQMKGNLRQQWVGGKMNIEDYRRKVAEIPLPTKPSQKPAASEKPETQLATSTPKTTPLAGQVSVPPLPLEPKPETPPAPKPLVPLPKKPPVTPQEPAEEQPSPTPAKPPAPDEPLPAKKPAPAAAAPEEPTHTFKEVKPEEFITHRNKTTRPENLSDLKAEEIQNHKLFTNQDNTIGAAVSPEGDIQNVFNNGGGPGAGAHAVVHAIEQHGGKTLDAYDDFLPSYYKQFGFHETGRMKFNPAFNPKWDTVKRGTPDVVFMGHGGEPEGGYAAAVARAKDKTKANWIPHEQSTHYDDDWDAQKARSQAFAGRTKDNRAGGMGQGTQTIPAGGPQLPGAGKGTGRPVAPGPGDVLPPTKKPPAPKKREKLVKPKDENKEWKGVPEADKQAYLEEKVKRTLADQIRDKATHKLVVQRDENGGVKYDPQGSPVYEQHDYDIANSPMLKKKALDQIKDADKHEDTLGNLIGPDGKEVIDPETGEPVKKHAHLNQTERNRLSAMHTASAVHTMGDKIFDSYNEAIKNPEIAAGEGWYSRMRKKLGDALGEHHELFAQLLGATSAKTPVRTNFINALDAFEQYKEGKFSKHIEKFLEAHGKLHEGEGALTQHMRDLGILKAHEADHESDADAIAHWIKHHDILPKSKIGNKYSANSNAVLKVLAGTWLKEVGAPKTPNFAGNLTGRTLEATIDVWAARHLQRLGYEGHGKGPWRAQPAAEPGVSNMDFAFSQDAMRHAAERIKKETGKDMNPDDLQAILWFAEKHHHEDRGWTRGQGAEKSSFDDVADRVFGKDGQPHEKPMDSTQLRAHYQAEAKALRQRKDKIDTAQSYLGTPKEQTHLPKYMAKHNLTHEEIHGAGPEEEEEEAA